MHANIVAFKISSSHCSFSLLWLFNPSVVVIVVSRGLCLLSALKMRSSATHRRDRWKGIMLLFFCLWFLCKRLKLNLINDLNEKKIKKLHLLILRVLVLLPSFGSGSGAHPSCLLLLLNLGSSSRSELSSSSELSHSLSLHGRLHLRWLRPQLPVLIPLSNASVSVAASLLDAALIWLPRTELLAGSEAWTCSGWRWKWGKTEHGKHLFLQHLPTKWKQNCGRFAMWLFIDCFHYLGCVFHCIFTLFPGFYLYIFSLLFLLFIENIHLFLGFLLPLPMKLQGYAFTRVHLLVDWFVCFSARFHKNYLT